MRSGKRGRVYNEQHILKHMIPIAQEYERMRNNGEAKLHNMTMFFIRQPRFVEECMSMRLDVEFEEKVE
jgi:hypothetical protein